MLGFHPSIDVGHRLLGQVIWKHLMEQYPGHIGNLNPNNAQITARFGDQGGY